MRQELVQAFMLKNGDCFDFVAAQEVQKKLEALDDSFRDTCKLPWHNVT